MSLSLHRKRRAIRHCSFCSKSEDEVFKLVTGPMVRICDECVAAAQEIIVEEKIERGAMAVIGRKQPDGR